MNRVTGLGTMTLVRTGVLVTEEAFSTDPEDRLAAYLARFSFGVL